MQERVAIVTGGNRGIGLATVNQLCRAGFNGTVYFTARNAKRGNDAVRRLNGLGCHPRLVVLDLRHRDQREAFAVHVRDQHGGVDVLVNNAAVRAGAHTSASLAVAVNVHVNYFCTLFLCQQFFPMLRPHARVVNLGSPCGHPSVIPSAHLRAQFTQRHLRLSNLTTLMEQYKTLGQTHASDVAPDWGNDSYCVSKMAVAALTFVQQRMINDRRPKDDIILNCYAPGDVRSQITGYADLGKPARSAEYVVRLATLPHHTASPVGQFVWHDLAVVNWTGATPDH